MKLDKDTSGEHEHWTISEDYFCVHFSCFILWT